MSRVKQKRSKNKVVTKHPMGGVVVPPIILSRKRPPAGEPAGLKTAVACSQLEVKFCQ